MGRPSTLTAEVADEIIRAVELGMPLDRAALAAGRSPTLVREWIARGEGTDPDRPATPDTEAFAEGVTRARALGERRLLEQIASAEPGTKEWRNLAWLLERTRREDYGAQLEITHKVRAEVIAEMERVSGVLRAVLDPATYPGAYEAVVRGLASDDGGSPETPRGDHGPH